MLENAIFSSRKPLWLGLDWGSTFGLIGVCSYVGSFAVPFDSQWDIPLIVLALASVLATLFSVPKGPAVSSPIVLSILLFLVATALSILTSEEISRSVRLSAPLLPSVLLFFLIANYFSGLSDTRLLYLTFSVVGFGLAAMLVWVALAYGRLVPETWVAVLGSPILVVKNDVTFLAVVAPLSLALMYCEFRGLVGVTATVSLLLSIVVVGVFQSRVAMVTMVASLVCTAGLLRPRLGLACGLASLVLILCIDAFLGFPLVAKFVLRWDGSGRIPLWLAAVAMFRDAPLLGHGPHTFVLFYRSYLEGLTLPSWLFTEPRIVPWAHNLYLEVLAEQGIVGLVSLGFLLACGLSQAWKIQRTAAGEVRTFGAAALGGLVGLCLAGTIELSLLRHWVVVTIFVLLGVIANLSFSQTIGGSTDDFKAS